MCCPPRFPAGFICLYAKILSWTVPILQLKLLFTHLTLTLCLVALKWDQVLTWQTLAEAIFPESLKKKPYFIFYYFTKQG